jgi:hypothetical protein
MRDRAGDGMRDGTAGDPAEDVTRYSFRDVGAEAGQKIEQELVALVRSGGSLRAALARIAYLFVGTKSWEPLGYARLTDYADERIGRSGRSVYDLARVGQVLCRLPKLRQALAEGGLGWTRVRLLARVATEANQTFWIDYARRVTTRVLSREVRKVDTGSVEGEALRDDRSQSRWIRMWLRHWRRPNLPSGSSASRRLRTQVTGCHRDRGMGARIRKARRAGWVAKRTDPQ